MCIIKVEITKSKADELNLTWAMEWGWGVFAACIDDQERLQKNGYDFKMMKQCKFNSKGI